MITIWMTYLVAAVAASGVFIIAGRRSRRVAGPANARRYGAMPHDPLWGEADTEFSEASPQTDAGVALHQALKRLSPVITSQGVQAEVAAPYGLSVRMRGGTLADMLEELLAAAIHSAPASRILLAAAAREDRIDISVTDDIPGADAEVRRASVRGLMDRVVKRGGVLDINVQPNEGTTMTLRLAAVPQPEPAYRVANVNHSQPDFE